MKQYRHHRSFTLIELIVSLAVFSILAALVMQFFSGAQRLWIDSEQRANAYAEARASMEVINELLASLLFFQGSDPAFDAFFKLDTSDNGNHKLFFMTKTRMALPMDQCDLRFVGLLRGADSRSGKTGEALAAEKKNPYNPFFRLYLTVFCDGSDCNGTTTNPNTYLYGGLLPPYGVYTGIDNRNQAAAQLAGSTSGKLLPANNGQHKSVLMERVIDFSVTAFDKSGALIPTAADTAEPPAMLQIRITQMDTADNLVKWVEDDCPDNDFKREHSRTFNRAFYLGSRE